MRRIRCGAAVSAATPEERASQVRDAITSAPPTGPYFHEPRSEEAARDALNRIVGALYGGASCMSIPADVCRDADLILADVITECVRLRASVATARAEGERVGLERGAAIAAAYEGPASMCMAIARRIRAALSPVPQ